MPPLPVPPASSVPAQPAQWKARWPWIVGGCGCLTLVCLCIAALVFFYSAGSIRKVRDQSKASSEKTPAPEASAPASTNPLQDKDVKIAAALQWLRLMDAGDYRASFAAASEEFRKDFGVADMWEITLSAMRNSSGAVVSRGDKVTLNTTVSGGDKPKVSYQLNIQTRFAKKTATEEVTLVKESGEWKVAKYRRKTVTEQPEASSEKTPAPEAPAPETSAPADREAINEAVVDWLGLLDKGDYRGSFAAASAEFRKGLTAEKWRASHASMQKQFGTLVSHGTRVTLRTRTSTTDGGKQEVTYILDIESKFSKATGTEHITLVMESGEWKVADYSIEVKTP